MRTGKYILAAALTIPLVLSGCSFFSWYETMPPVKILVYADSIDVARKVATLLAETPNMLVVPTAEMKSLEAAYIDGFDVIALLPVRVPPHYFPDGIVSGLRKFVWEDGKGIIGMHDVLFLQSPIMYEIFGGQIESNPTDELEGGLSITVKRYSPIAYGVPGQFTLTQEHPVETRPEANVCRLFNMSSPDTKDGYCAGWSYISRKGAAFYFAPGHSEETRYNPDVIRIIRNAAIWIAHGKRHRAD